ncbi:hypothetical protein STEG23_006720 [Scotinomys teguina]
MEMKRKRRRERKRKKEEEEGEEEEEEEGEEEEPLQTCPDELFAVVHLNVGYMNTDSPKKQGTDTVHMEEI